MATGRPKSCPVRAVAQRLAGVGFHRRVFDCTPPRMMQTGTSSVCGGLTEGQEGGCVRHGGGSLSFGVKRSLRRTLFSWSTTSRRALTFTVRGHWHRNTPLATRSGSSCEVEDATSAPAPTSRASSGESLDGLTEKREEGWREDIHLFIYPQTTRLAPLQC